MEQQPISQLRKGRSRSRSDSVARSFSRSRSRSPQTQTQLRRAALRRRVEEDAEIQKTCHDLPGAKSDTSAEREPHVPDSRAPALEDLEAKRYALLLVGLVGAQTMTLREMKSVIAPNTDEALMKLVEPFWNSSDEWYSDPEGGFLGVPLKIAELHSQTGPETFTATELLTIALAVRDLPPSRRMRPELLTEVARDTLEAEIKLRRLHTMKRKVTIENLVSVARDSGGLVQGQIRALALLSLVKKARDKYMLTSQVPGQPTWPLVDFDMLTAETGPATMPAPLLLKIVLAAAGPNDRAVRSLDGTHCIEYHFEWQDTKYGHAGPASGRG